jgi:Tol biopolymer transport system component
MGEARDYIPLLRKGRGGRPHSCTLERAERHLRLAQRDLWVKAVDGDSTQRLTDTPEITDPDWSRDGARIYYASTVSGRSEIWKMPAGGGKGVQLTTEGGFEPPASADGRSPAPDAAA